MKKQKLLTRLFIVLILTLGLSGVLSPARFKFVNALPGASYRYSVTSCSTSDNACVDNSAQAGVYRIFRATLNRNPDSNGYAYWTNSLINGTSLSSMSASILNSSEWKNKYSGLNNQQFVNQTYQFLLYRSPDPDGYNYWLGQLNNGKSRASMVATMAISNEAMNKNRSSFLAFYQPPTPPNPPSPPNPPKPPTPPNPPKPSTPSAPKPSGGSSNPKPTASKTSQAGLSISDLAVANVGYDTATITWKTNKAADSKVNFSVDKNDLYSEQKNDTKDTNHSVELPKDALKAGNYYYFRVTSNDGSGPATMDSEFETKAITVIISVTDENNTPISEAKVHINETSQTTGEDGTALFDLPEGTATIIAEKDDLSKEISEDITVPESEAPVQISIALSKKAASSSPAVSTTKKRSSFVWLWLLLTLLPVAAVVGFIIWRKRSAVYAESYGDPLEAENYSQPPQPIPDSSVPAADIDVVDENWTPSRIEAPEPDYQPLNEQHAPHHSTLPELVGRYGTAQAQKEKPSPAGHENVESTQKTISPTGTPIPKHSSLKDLVALPGQSSNQSNDIDPATDDLPVSPAQEKHSHRKKNKQSDDDSLLTIEH